MNTTRKITLHTIGVELMYPFWTSIEAPVKGFDLMNLDLQFKLTVQLASWATLSYVFSAKRVPMLVDRWQISNQMALGFTAKFF